MVTSVGGQDPVIAQRETGTCAIYLPGAFLGHWIFAC